MRRPAWLNLQGAPSRTLIALIGGQICLHASMAGLRLAGPLLVLNAGHSAWWVGVMLALFAAAPIVTAMQVGRLADRRGYHLPLRIAVGLSFGGGLMAFGSTFFAHDSPVAQYALLCVAAVLSGTGANAGLITIQRTAGRDARALDKARGGGSTEMKRVFSWLGLAPSMANMLGSLVTGLLIDAAGFRGALAVLALLPLGALVWARRVPVEPIAPPARERQGAALPMWRSALELVQVPGVRRLLLVNWMLSSSWDVHGFLVPLLGHQRGMSASAIGAVLAAFGFAVSGVRVFLPWLAHRLREAQVLASAMLVVALAFALYPLAFGPWTMGVCAALLGLALGASQPMILSTLHLLTPEQRHGEAIALRSMTINLSSTLMPLGFGAAGATLGASGLFWLMSVWVGAGSWPARGLEPQPVKGNSG